MANTGFDNPGMIDLFSEEFEGTPGLGEKEFSSAMDGWWSLRRTSTVSQLPDGSFVTADENGNINRI